MNAAKLSRSKRLQRVLRFWSDKRWHSTMQTILRAKVCAVNSIAAEMRVNGYKVDCERRGDVWYYRLA